LQSVDPVVAIPVWALGRPRCSLTGFGSG